MKRLSAETGDTESIGGKMRQPIYAWAFVGVLAAAYALSLTYGDSLATRAAPPQTAEWPWDDSLDAVVAAPHSHVVLLENDDVRVISVEIKAGEKEPAHTHRHPSVMIVHQPTRIRYFGVNGEAEFESPEGPRPASASEPKWMEPEGLHAVENVDTLPYKAYRIELKDRGR